MGHQAHSGAHPALPLRCPMGAVLPIAPIQEASGLAFLQGTVICFPARLKFVRLPT